MAESATSPPAVEESGYRGFRLTLTSHLSKLVGRWKMVRVPLCSGIRNSFCVLKASGSSNTSRKKRLDLFPARASSSLFNCRVPFSSLLYRLSRRELCLVLI